MTKINILCNAVELCAFEVIENDFSMHMVPLLANGRGPTVNYIVRHNDIIKKRCRFNSGWESDYRRLFKTYQKFLYLIGEKDAYNINPVFDYTNTDTNKLHRIFTRADRFSTYNSKKINLCQKGHKLINQINDYCHTLEQYITNTHQESPTRWLEIFPQDREEHKIDLENVPVVDDEECNVYAMYEILGKSFECAFLDNDVIAEDVMAKGEFTFPGVMIDLYDDLKNLRQSSKFKQWTADSQNPIGVIPVGKLISRNLNLTETNNFENIKIILT